MTILGIYRSPSENIMLFLKLLTEFLDALIKAERNITIIGDFNIDMAKQNV